MNGISTATGPASRDPFLEQFFSRLPDEMHTDFTNHQLAALKSVFGDTTRSGHDFDIRFVHRPAERHQSARHCTYTLRLSERSYTPRSIRNTN